MDGVWSNHILFFFNFSYFYDGGDPWRVQPGVDLASAIDMKFIDEIWLPKELAGL